MENIAAEHASSQTEMKVEMNAQPSPEAVREFYSIIDYTMDGPQTQHELAEAFSEIHKQWVRFYPGYLGARIVASLDGTRLYNIVRWRSEADFRSFVAVSDTQGRMAAIDQALAGLSGKAEARMTQAPHYQLLQAVEPGPAPSEK
jgi:C-6 monooxygenase